MDCGGALAPTECIITIDTTEGVFAVPSNECKAPRDAMEGASDVAVRIECNLSKDIAGVEDRSVTDVEASDATEIKKGTESYAQCRICQEEGDINDMESPCGCTGSLKYVHSECVQRWCDNKGDTICEICHQQYRNGYHVKPLLQSDMTGTPSLDPLGVGPDPINETPPQELEVRPTQGDRFRAAKCVFVWLGIGVLCAGLVSLFVVAVILGVIILRSPDGVVSGAFFADLILVGFAVYGLILVEMYMKKTILELEQRRRLQEAERSVNQDLAGDIV